MKKKMKMKMKVLICQMMYDYYHIYYYYHVLWFWCKKNEDNIYEKFHEDAVIYFYAIKLKEHKILMKWNRLVPVEHWKLLYIVNLQAYILAILIFFCCSNIKIDIDFVRSTSKATGSQCFGMESMDFYYFMFSSFSRGMSIVLELFSKDPSIHFKFICIFWLRLVMRCTHVEGLVRKLPLKRRTICRYSNIKITVMMIDMAMTTLF